MANERQVKIVEVGPRDGLQAEANIVSTDVKVELIDRLSQAGFANIEAASFVSPKWVPQTADGASVMRRIARRAGTTYSALVPNLKGLERAIESNVDEIVVFGAASEAFSQKNESLRYCRGCIARGYHRSLYQIERVVVCPVHSLPLEAACRTCGYEAPYMLNVRLLEAPYRCANCGAGYGGKRWSPGRLQPMSAEHRRAITRVYFERGLW